MLKFYGSDMFAIPKMLREMDPGRLDTFRSIYGQHLGVAMRHIEELRELEKDLFSKHWSAELEEKLIPQLPWPEKDLETYSAPGKTGRESPFLLVSNLASLVAIRRGDFDLLPKVGPYMLSSGSRPDLELEAALQISNWRVAGNTYLENLRYPAMSCLRAAEPKTMLVILSQAYLGEDGVKAPEEALTSSDFEVAFFAALLLGNKRVLIRALDSNDPLQWMVAANKLIRLKEAPAILDVFRRKANIDQQLNLLGTIQLEKRAVPELHEALFEVIDKNLEVDKTFSTKSKLARLAAAVLCFDCSHAEAMRLAQTLDWDILHALSLAKAVAPETLREVGVMLVRENLVKTSAFAWTCMAREGRMPLDFVEGVFSLAGTPETQSELLRFAKIQGAKLPRRFFENSFSAVGTPTVQIQFVELAVEQTGELAPAFAEHAVDISSAPETRLKILYSAKNPADLFERVFPCASAPSAQMDMLRYAERFLGKTGTRPRGTPMERLLLRVAFGDFEESVVIEAWSGLYRTNMNRDSQSRKPFRYAIETIEEIMTVPEYAARLGRLRANRSFAASTVGSELQRFPDPEPPLS